MKINWKTGWVNSLFTFLLMLVVVNIGAKLEYGIVFDSIAMYLGIHIGMKLFGEPQEKE